MMLLSNHHIVNMDATSRPLLIPPEISNYAEKHGIFDLYKRLLTELVIKKPDHPLDFIIEFLKRDDDVPRIVVMGPPASGKGSISQMLCKALGAEHVTMDSVLKNTESSLSAQSAEAQEHCDNDSPVPVDLWAQLVHNRLQQSDVVNKGWVLDAMIDTRQQAHTLSALGIMPKHCILLDAPDTVLIERADGKRVDPETGDIYHLTFDWPSSTTVATRIEPVPGTSEEEMVNALVTYHRNVAGIKTCYQHVLKVINADQPKADVFSQVMTFVCQPARSAAPHTPRVILVGPTGCGKSTQASLLADKYNLVDVCCGHLIKQALAARSSIGLACSEYVEENQPVPDALVLKLVTEQLGQLDCVSRGWVLHGYPRTRSQAESLADAGFTANRVFFMDISSEAVMERLTLKATDPYTGTQYHLLYNPPMTQEVKDRLQVNPKWAEEAVVAELAEYQAYREELVEFYGGQRINADQDSHTVFETLEGLIVNPLPTCTNE